jgi:hypothetical protein
MTPMRLGWALASLVVLACASPALANSFSPTLVGFFPGLPPLSLGLGLPATVLAAVLERPFVTRAGVREHALWYSLQANFVSLVLGYVTFPLALVLFILSGHGILLWPPIAVTISIWSEGEYSRRRVLRHGPLRWSSIVWGNLLSNLVLLAVPYGAQPLYANRPTLVWDLDPDQDDLFWSALVASGGLFVVSFLLPGRMRHSPRSPGPGLPQSTVAVTPPAPNQPAHSGPATTPCAGEGP